MNKSIDIGIVGIGRMGWVHARHLLELERETGFSRLAAVVDLDVPKTRRFASEMGYTGKLFASLEEYLAWGGTKATMIVTRTESRYCGVVALGPELEAKSHFAYVFAHHYGNRVC